MAKAHDMQIRGLSNYSHVKDEASSKYKARNKTCKTVGARSQVSLWTKRLSKELGRYLSLCEYETQAARPRGVSFQKARFNHVRQKP